MGGSFVEDETERFGVRDRAKRASDRGNTLYAR
jgi:hypothetical protein